MLENYNLSLSFLKLTRNQTYITNYSFYNAYPKNRNFLDLKIKVLGMGTDFKIN